MIHVREPSERYDELKCHQGGLEPSENSVDERIWGNPCHRSESKQSPKRHQLAKRKR